MGGTSVVSFSVDSQGEADDLVNQLMEQNLVADVNFLSSMVNRKFSLYGAVTSDPSQVRVELVTSDAKSGTVVNRISNWRQANGKSNSGQDNDAVVTQLTGGSAEYISFVLRQTSGQSVQPQLRSSTQLLMAAQTGEGEENNENNEKMMAQTGSITN